MIFLMKCVFTEVNKKIRSDALRFFPSILKNVIHLVTWFLLHCVITKFVLQFNEPGKCFVICQLTCFCCLVIDYKPTYTNRDLYKN